MTATAAGFALGWLLTSPALYKWLSEVLDPHYVTKDEPVDHDD
jgi:hypothetical protein